MKKRASSALIKIYEEIYQELISQLRRGRSVLVGLSQIGLDAPQTKVYLIAVGILSLRNEPLEFWQDLTNISYTAQEELRELCSRDISAQLTVLSYEEFFFFSPLTANLADCGAYALTQVFKQNRTHFWLP